MALFWNALIPTSRSPAPLTRTNAVQPENAEASIETAVSGRVTDCKAVLFLNADLPIPVTTVP